MKTASNVLDKEFADEIIQLIDGRHRDELRKVDSKYRSLKDSLEKWSKQGAGLFSDMDWVGPNGEKNKENLKLLMDELRAD